MSGGFALAADAVLVLHVGIVAFVVGGLLAVVVGNLAGWGVVNRPLFRWLHLSAIMIVAAQAVLGVDCPLTVLEAWLRTRAGLDAHPGSFVAYWLQRVLYYEAPAWVFTIGYVSFAAVVLACWWRWPPVKGHPGAADQRGH